MAFTSKTGYSKPIDGFRGDIAQAPYLATRPVLWIGSMEPIVQAVSPGAATARSGRLTCK
jgi:hypothetical protein